MNTHRGLHEMVTSEAFTVGEWSDPACIRQLLPVEAYTGADWFERERRELFGRTWAFACLEEDVPSPGDYRCIDNGDAALVLIRDPAGRLRAFHNVCRHRGARLLDGTGRIAGSALTCFYHKWSYNLADDFRLVGVPHQQSVLPALDRACHALHPAAVGIWQHLVFVHPDPAASFDEWLGNLPAMLGPFEPGQTAIHDPARLVDVSDASYRVRANWKIVTENFIDGYHLPLLHAASLSDGGFMEQRWRAVGRHQAFYRPVRRGVAQEDSYLGHYDDDRPWPTIDGVPASYGASYQWLFPNLGLFQTATSWSTFHVVPVEPALSLVHSRVRAMPVDDMPEDRIVDPADLPDYIVSARGRSLSWIEPKTGSPAADPLESGNVMREDIFACERVQRGLASPRAAVGTLSRWEAPVAFFQRQVMDFVPQQD